MSILLVDVGNTRVKWARLRGERLGRQRAAAHADWSTDDFGRHVFGAARGIERIVVVSVAGARVEGRLAAAARRYTGFAPEFIAVKRRAGGVTTLYTEPWRLGADRFVATIGALRLAKGRAVCVISVGTAMTIDLLDARARHRGGAIVPGPALMIDSLLTRTSGIRRRAAGVPAAGHLFARNTRAAIEQGARYAAATVVDRAVTEARHMLGGAPLVLLTGGAARTVRPLIRSAHKLVPDLVLQGLAALASERA
jgi:type III pantothenate kinase